MGLAEKFKNKVLQASEKMVEKVLADEQRARWVAEGVGAFQRGVIAWNQKQDRWMTSLEVAPKSDFKRVGKKLAQLKRRLRDIEENLE